MLCVVSGQMVVHSESATASITTRPRNWLSDITWPNWFVSLMSGADWSPSVEPRSRFGLASAAAIAEALPACCDEDGEPQPATTTAAAAASSAVAAKPARVLRIGEFTENEATPPA